MVVKKRIIFILISLAMMTMGLTETQLSQLLPQGAVVVTPGGLMGCLKHVCRALQVTVDPVTNSTFTKVYVGYTDVGPDGMVKSVNFSSNSTWEYGEELVLVNGGELTPSNGNVIGQPLGSNSGSGIRYVPSENIDSNVVGVDEKLVPDSSSSNKNQQAGGSKSKQGENGENGADGSGLKALGRLAFGILSSQLSYTSGKNVHIELAKNLALVEGSIRSLNIQAFQLTKFTSHLVGQGVVVPASVVEASKNYDPSKQSQMVEISSLSEVKSHTSYPKSLPDDINKNISAGDLKKLAKQVDFLADQGSTQRIKNSKLGSKLNDGVVKVQNLAQHQGVYDTYQFKTNPDSVYGKMVRRAANKAQIAQASALTKNKNLIQSSPEFNLSVAMLNIADQRFATRGILQTYLQQAEGMARLAEEMFEVMGPGVTKGFEATLVGYADALYAIPGMGDQLVDAAKFAVTDPVTAMENMWEVLGETPEFVDKVLVETKDFIRGFHKLPLDQQSELIGSIMAEGLIGLGTGAAGKSLKAAAGVSKTVSITKKLGKTKFATKLKETMTKISKSDDFVRAVEAAPPHKPAFYVKPNGEALPSTAYRYMPSDAAYIDELVKTGKIPEGKYFSFEKFDDMANASDKLQVPHDARFRVEVDMLDYLDETTIPNGKWGKADYLEPITRDFPVHGEGGATQVLINKPVQVDKLIDLKSGKILLEKGPNGYY